VCDDACPNASGGTIANRYANANKKPGNKPGT
jgi:hypothetical protein